jgi:aspartate carbamoyltransferase catalytic subunit
MMWQATLFVIIHSRVAHSDIQALKTLGTSDIRLISPAGLQYDSKQCMTVKCFSYFCLVIYNNIIFTQNYVFSKMRAFIR